MGEETVTYAEIKRPKSASGKIKAGPGRDNHAAPKRNRLIMYQYCIAALGIICFLLAAAVALLLIQQYTPRDYLGELCNGTNENCYICPEHWVGYHGKCYLFSKEMLEWHASKEFCSTQKASLLTNPDDDVMEFAKKLTGSAFHWVGLNNISNIWTWESNQTLNKTGFPIRISATGIQHCAALDTNGLSSSSCSVLFRYVCVKNTVKKLQ